ncbi:MAG TPA: PilN domain-containing protein [Flavobacterium sp.]|uniref:PilN domain-containing protein n=1 Tax=Flavobacterium sp. TaxID=239 RepID=UPI002DBA7023|nr:PilN domain-containing protein [Flavobacterium sp.]HEU4789339.1 PilN domain-containing protein [Flavobacterium sp.]
MNIPSLTSLLIGKQYIGIEHFSFNNEEKTAILLIEKKKEELVITQKDKVSYSEKIAKKWDKKLPFFLVINTNQVIQKEIDAIDATDEKLLHKSFPNTNWDEFYFEIWRLKTKSIIAISRKSYIDELLSNYHKQGIAIAGISLGVCSIAEIVNYTDENELFTNHQSISCHDENQIIKTVRADLNTTYNINGLAIKNNHLLAFAGILRLLLNTTMNTGNSINYSQELYENYNQQSFFSKGIKLTIGILLTILLVNFFTFTHYYTLVQETSESLLLSKSSLEDVAKTKQRVHSKEQKVKNVVAMTSSQSSLIINELAKRIPQSILLTELIYHPLEKKIKNEESIVIQEKIVTISGTTINNEAFTHWIETIEQLKWINQVVITGFGKNDLNETEFSIKITLK